MMLKWLISVHILTIMIVFFSNLSWSYQLIVSVFVIISCYNYLRCLSRGNIIRYSKVLGWEWLNTEQKFSSIEVLPSTVITRLFIALHYRYKDKKKAIIICRDSLSKDDYRQFLVSLKINGLN